MRLSRIEIELINLTARKYFGQETKVFLFGSRVDDSLKGGDIDLFIHNDQGSLLKLETKIHFLSELKMKIGDQKIDVVFDNETTRSKTNFYRSIQNNNIELQ